MTTFTDAELKGMNLDQLVAAYLESDPTNDGRLTVARTMAVMNGLGEEFTDRLGALAILDQHSNNGLLGAVKDGTITKYAKPEKFQIDEVIRLALSPSAPKTYSHQSYMFKVRVPKAGEWGKVVQQHIIDFMEQNFGSMKENDKGQYTFDRDENSKFYPDKNLAAGIEIDADDDEE